MKKHLVKLLTLSALILTGCTGNPSTTPTSTPTSESTSTPASESTSTPASESTSTAPALPTFTIVLASRVTEVEKGQSITLRVNIACSDSKAKKTVNWTIEQDDEFIAFDETANPLDNAGAIKIQGLKKGTAKVIATATGNPDNKLEVEITVKAPVSPLRNVWNNIIEAQSYTIDVTRTATAAETVAHSNWDEETAVPVSKLLATSNALIFKAATDVQDDLSATYASAFTNGLIGYGVDKNHHVFELVESASGFGIAENGKAVKTDIGLLNGANFKGAGQAANTPNDAGFFAGLEATNPLWLSATKDTTNSYVIDAPTDADQATLINCVFAETTILSAVSPLKLMELAPGKTFLQLADMYTTTINVIDNLHLTIDLEFTDGTVYHATVSDVATTVNPTGLDDFLVNAEVELPALAPEIQAFKDAVEKHDYVVTYERSSYTSHSYVTPNYALELYYDTTVATPTLILAEGVAKKDNKFYEITYVAPTEEEEGGLEFTDVTADLTGDPKNGITVNDELWEIYSYYFESYVVDEFWYNLSDVEKLIFTGYPESYVNYNTLGNAYFSNFISPDLPDVILNASGSVVLLTIDSTTNTDGDVILSSVDTMLGVERGGDQYSVYYSPSFASFGKANDVNPFKTDMDNFFNPVE